MNANDLFTTITDQLVADIEAGAGTWRMPWHTLADAGTPTSIDRRPYRGMNALWLPMVAAANGWTSGVWATYRGWQRHGAQVRRGERGTHVVLWKPTTGTGTDTEPTTDETTAGPRRRLLARAYVRVRRRTGRRRRRHPRAPRRRARRPRHPRADRRRRRVLRRRRRPRRRSAATGPATSPAPTRSACPTSPSSTTPPTSTAPAPTSTSTGPATPTGSPATSPAGSAPTPTPPRSSSPSSAPPCGAPRPASAPPPDPTTPPTSPAGSASCAPTPGPWSPSPPGPSRRRPPQHPRRPPRHRRDRRLTGRPGPGRAGSRRRGVPLPTLRVGCRGLASGAGEP